jgi:restriction system protein
LKEAEMDAIPSQVRAMSSRNVIVPKITEATQQFGRAEIDDSKTRQLTSTIFEEWRDTLLDVLQQIPPASFEKLCQRVLRESGFTRVQITGKSGDGGVDGIGVLRIALLSFHVFFQCKRYKGSVGASAIRDFRGAMVGRTDKGLFITTGSFTPEAKREATRDGAPVLDLIHGEALCAILKDLSLGVGTRQVEEVSINPTWFSAL